MVRLAAVVLCMPLSGVSASGWDGPQYRPGSYVYPSVTTGNRTLPSDYDSPTGRGYYRPQPAATRQTGPVSPYRFRAWQPSSDPRSMQHVSYWGGGTMPRQPAWEMSYPKSQNRPPLTGMRPAGSGNAFPMSQYRFRPLPAEPRPQVVSQPRYLPLQVPIAEHYVFRPLNPVSRPQPSPRFAYQRPQMPMAMPARPQYQFNRPARVMQPYQSGRYAYGVYPSARPAWQPEWTQRNLPARDYRQFRLPPRDIAQGMPLDYRYRPLAAMPSNRQRLGNRYAPYNWRGVPPPPQYLAMQYGPYGQRPVPPPWAMGYPPAMRTAYRPEAMPAMPKRYGTDWYDGRGDGEGAWYKLAGVSGPAVTQQWHDAGGMSVTGEN